MDLKKIVDTPGYGSGKAARDVAAAEAAAKSRLIPRQNVAPVVAATSDDGGVLVPLCHFGNSTEHGGDWGLYHRGIDDLRAPALGLDAKTDAEIVAAIVNCYRLGILTVRN